MKKLILTISLLLSFTLSFCQLGVSLIFSPEDKGLGPMISYHHNNFVYGTGITYGNYYCIKDHFKSYAFIGYFIDKQGYFGISHHYNTFSKDPIPFWIDKRAITPHTFSFQGGVELERFISTILYDPIQGVGSITFGFIINNKR